MPVPVTCKFCGKEFTKPACYVKKTSNHYCSNECYHAGTKYGRMVACPICGKETHKAPSQIEQGRRFCSRACYEEGRKAEMVTKVCKTCGEEFTVARAIADRYTVCSWECRKTSQVVLVCARCGKEFTTNKNKYPRKHCSEACRRPPHYINCRNCNKRFRIVPGDKTRQFCSFSCYRRFQGETLPEKAMRHTLDALGITYTQEAKLGRYSVDFLLTNRKVALEVDGVYWHRNKARDKRKNKFLEARGWRICRISDKEIEDAPHLDRLLVERLKEVAAVELTPLQPSLFDYPK